MSLSLSSSPVPTPKEYNNRATIDVDTNSILFRNLSVTLYYFKNPTTGTLSNFAAELAERGMGVPGLMADTMTPFISMHSGIIVFDLAFEMELRIGSMSKEGLSVPLPFPLHQCNIHGSYNIRKKAGDATFTHHE